MTRMDPILERTKRQFDQLGQQSMLLDNLPIDDMLGLQLVRKSETASIYPPWGTYNGEWNVEDPLMILIEFSNFRSGLRESVHGMMTDEKFDRLMEE